VHPIAQLPDQSLGVGHPPLDQGREGLDLLEGQPSLVVGVAPHPPLHRDLIGLVAGGKAIVLVGALRSQAEGRIDTGAKDQRLGDRRLEGGLAEPLGQPAKIPLGLLPGSLADLRRHLRVTDREHAATHGVDHLRSLEAEVAEVTKGAGLLATDSGAKAVGAILDQIGVVGFDHLRDLADPGGNAVEMSDDDRPGVSLLEDLGQRLRVHAQRLQLAVRKPELVALGGHQVGDDGVAESGADDLGTGLEIHRLENKAQTRAGRRHRDRGGHTDGGGEGLLQLLYRLTLP
jgi:hypothetical protein